MLNTRILYGCPSCRLDTRRRCYIGGRLYFDVFSILIILMINQYHILRIAEELMSLAVSSDPVGKKRIRNKCETIM